MSSLPVPPSKANKNPNLLNPNAASFTPTMATPKTHEPTSFQKSLGLPHQIFPVPQPQPMMMTPLLPHWPLATQGYSYMSVLPPFHQAAGMAFYDVFSQPQPQAAGGYSGAYHVGYHEYFYGAVSDRVVVDQKAPKRFVSPRMRENKDRKLAWVAKNPAALNCKEDQSDHHPSQQTHLGGNTSIMIRNIPNQFQRRDLIRILDRHCREENTKAQRRSDPCTSAYDFLYLPMDFLRGANLGYAFVNFTNAVAAAWFYIVFHKFQWEVTLNRKICEIYCAKYQGKEALRFHFEKSRFTCHTNGYLPVVLSPPRDGWNRSKPTPVGQRIGVNQKRSRFST